jgi:DNA-binding transcriptional regulator YhcF (GntR family)
MGPRLKPQEMPGAVDQVRTRLLTGLHFGHYRPGDRAPSIRRMAALTHLNHKTVHRAYRLLADEGLLDVRWGSGTFFRESRPSKSHTPSPGSLLDAVARCRVEADHLGVSSGVFMHFLESFIGDRLHGARVAVAECNREQIGLIERELRAGLGVETREVLITDLVAHHPSLLSGIHGVVTTDCHLQEVKEMVASRGLPVYRVALAPQFTHTMIRQARKGPVLMVVRDRSYGPVFLRMLRQMQVPAEFVERFRIVETRDLDATAMPRQAGSFYISPLVSRDVRLPVPRGLRRILPGRYLAEASVEELKAQLALDLALQSG